MKYKNLIQQLPDDEKAIVLQELVRLCKEYGGESYEDFGRRALRFLVKVGILDYGEE